MNTELEQLKQKELKLKEKIKMVENKLKEKDRKSETRKKILFGAMVLHQMEKNEEYKTKMMKNLDNYLTSERDRKLFNFEIK